MVLHLSKENLIIAILNTKPPEAARSWIITCPFKFGKELFEGVSVAPNNLPALNDDPHA
jgi:hypothetical protein